VRPGDLGLHVVERGGWGPSGLGLGERLGEVGAAEDSVEARGEQSGVRSRPMSWTFVVELRRIELLTSSMPWKRSTN
jgi:hypothetical protein